MTPEDVTTPGSQVQGDALHHPRRSAATERAKSLVRWLVPAPMLRAVRREVQVRRTLRSWRSETDVAALPLIVRPFDTCWDIGANTGMFTSPLHRLARRVVAFEPIPDSRAILRTVVRRGRMSNVSILPYAVGRSNGAMRMTVPTWGFQAGFSMAHLDPQGDVPVEGRTIDALVASGVPRPAFIKCDVEGAEDAVIDGALELLVHPARPTWLLETFEDRVFDRMVALGYRAYEYDHVTRALCRVARRKPSVRNYWFIDADVQSRPVTSQSIDSSVVHR